MWMNEKESGEKEKQNTCQKLCCDQRARNRREENE